MMERSEVCRETKKIKLAHRNDEALFVDYLRVSGNSGFEELPKPCSVKVTSKS